MGRSYTNVGALSGEGGRWGGFWLSPTWGQDLVEALVPVHKVSDPTHFAKKKIKMGVL